ncbi:MAG TPA: sulfite exporter TauE/SafE family protein [Oscillospiraceae bacterium]|nr:sulfite exporter TauE/SafE family protein [Oscillospiraceae bacterium]
MNTVFSCIAAFLTGIAASMGLGGGMILIVFLTVFCGISQIEAQGINLVFFIPIALSSLIFHSKNKLIEWRDIIPSIVTGSIGAILGTYAAEHIGSPVLGKLFAGFLLIVGIKELFSKREKDIK